MARNSYEDEATIARRARLHNLQERLADFIEEHSAEGVASDLVSLAIAVLAGKYPATLTKQEKEKIRDNFPGATDSLITERALSRDGLVTALALTAQMGQIVIDYSPLSHCKPSVENDKKQQSVVRDILEPQLSATYEAAVSAGLSPYGASTMLIALGALYGTERGVSWAAIARPLLESIELAMRQSMPRSSEFTPEAEEQAIRTLMGMMGISRAEAKKYAEAAKKMRDAQR